MKTSISTYVYIWSALMLLLLLTLGSAYLPLGSLNSVINVVIAVAKSLLVAVFFMHLRFASPLMRIFSIVALIMLAILIGLSSTDYATRVIHTAPWSSTVNYHDSQ